MDWMLMPLRRYADFNGRSQRKEYWMFVLGYFLAMIVVGVVYAISHLLGGIIFCVLALGLFVPAIAVMIRRFHDQDKSGWFVLLHLIPYVGGIIVLVFMCIEGTRGPNRFGPDPKGGASNMGDVFA
jgi:uncharacterized membrane protein YhaH (DUF805 family)